MDRWGQLFEIARSRHGVVALADAAEVGLSASALRRRAEREGWRRPHDAVFVPPGVDWDFPQRAMSALLAAGQPSFIAGWSAAHLYGWVRRPPRRMQLLLPYERGAPHLRGVYVHRSRRLPPEHTAVVDGIAVTSPERTLCDLAMWAGARHLGDLAARAISDGQVTVPRLLDAVELLGPRRGARSLRGFVLRSAADGRTDSGLERKVRALLRRAGLRPAPGVHPVRVNGRLLGLVDIAFPEQRVAVEVDGFAWHRTPGDMRRDHARQNALHAAGWRLIRCGDADLRAPEEFLASLRAVLGQA